MDDDVNDDLHLRIGNGNDTASHEVVARQEAEVVRRDARCDVTTSWREQRGGVRDGCMRWLHNDR